LSVRNISVKEILLYLIVVIGIGSDLVVSGQTWTQSNAPITNWQCIASSADGTKLVALNNLYGIYASTNSGSTWQSATNGPVLMYSSWSGLAGSADGAKWVAVALFGPGAPGNGGIFVSTNSGIGWTRTSTIGALGGVACSADGTKMFATGIAVYGSTDSGTTWNPVNSANEYWESIATSADGSKVVATTYLNSIYLSTNSGTTWTQYGSLGRNWFPVISAADGVELATVNTGVGICTSTNSGISWTTNNLPVGGWIGLASSADGNHLVAVATNGWIFTSTNSGNNWYSNNVPTNRWSGAAISADGCKMAAIVYGGGIFTSYTPPKPVLSLAVTNNSLNFGWTVAATNLVVEQISNITKVKWAKLTNAPVLNPSTLRYQLTLPKTNAYGFFRLTTP
jgi:hypothetical protein